MPATLRPPAGSATQEENALEYQHEGDALEGSGILWLLVELKRRLAGISRLRPQERVAAYRAAIEWYQANMAAHKERNKLERHADRELRKNRRRLREAGIRSLRC